MSMSKRSSSSTSARIRASDRGRRRNLRMPLGRRTTLSLLGVEHGEQRRDVGAQLGGLILQLLAAGRRQLVKLGATIGLRDAPPRAHQALLLEAVQRLVQRGALQPDRPARPVAYELRDRIAV